MQNSFLTSGASQLPSNKNLDTIGAASSHNVVPAPLPKALLEKIPHSISLWHYEAVALFGFTPTAYPETLFEMLDEVQLIALYTGAPKPHAVWIGYGPDGNEVEGAMPFDDHRVRVYVCYLPKNNLRPDIGHDHASVERIRRTYPAFDIKNAA